MSGKKRKSSTEADCLLADEVACPICSRVFTVSEIEEHVDRCIFLNSPSGSSSSLSQSDRSTEPPKRDSSPKLNNAEPFVLAKKQKSANGGEPSSGLSNGSTVSIKKAQDQSQVSLDNKSAPLAEQVRPKDLGTFVGQEKVVGKNSILRSLLKEGEITSMILWGPPGCGKTTLANIVNNCCREGRIAARFVKMSAVASGVNDVKEVIKAAKVEMVTLRRRTVLFMDEIHRFNKLQQDIFLPHVENGTIILIGATTENPSFSLNNALLSRCRVVVLEKLSSEEVTVILSQALKALDAAIVSKGEKVSGKRLVIEEDALKFLADICDGDARIALNSLQLSFQSKMQAAAPSQITVSLDDIKEGVKKSHMLYDRGGEEHYNIISAVHKSIRASDQNAALYWTARLIVSGEDPRYLARRLVRAAAEDVGLADPAALPMAVAAMQGCQLLGMPEADILLSQCAVYLARAPKSREMQNCLDRAKECIRDQKGPQPSVPLHLRNAPTRLMKDLGYGKGYSHVPSEVPEMKYMPEGLEKVNFFK